MKNVDNMLEMDLDNYVVIIQHVIIHPVTAQDYILPINMSCGWCYQSISASL